MAEPVKVKFENVDNIEAEVPGTQKVRGAGNNENGEVQHESKTRQRLENAKPDRRHNVNTNNEDKSKDKRTKTRIPVSRFKQTVERVKVERRGSVDKKELSTETQIPVRRSSIPKQTNSKGPAKPMRKSIAKIEVTDQVTAPVDEFDKLYEEVVLNTPTPVNIDVSILDLKVEDPEKLEIKFEEIIHDYDENTVQPVEVEKIKKSKIPFLKRKSHNEIDFGDKNSKIIAARNRLRKRHHSLKSNDLNDLKQAALKNYGTADNKLKFGDKYKAKLEETGIVENTAAASDEKFKKDVQSNAKYEDTNNNTAVDNKVSESFNSNPEVTSHSETIIVTSSKDSEEEVESAKVVGTSLVSEIETNEGSDKVENTTGQLVEEDIYVGYDIKIDYPVFDSYMQEYEMENKTALGVEVEEVLFNTPENEDIKVETNVEIIETNNESTLIEVVDNVELSTTDTIETSESPLVSENSISTEKQKETDDIKEVMKEKDGSTEDIAKLRGKVTRLISKMGSRESDAEAHNIDFGKGLPKKKSVLSKIAMFERHDAEPVIKPKITKKDKLPIRVTTNKKITENVHVHTPLVVDEVFKPFQEIEDNNIDVNNDKITTNTDITQIVKAEMVIIESPDLVHYEVEAQLEPETLSIEKSKISEEVLIPTPRTFEPRIDHTNENDKKDPEDTPVIIPKFIRVKDVLKRYESLNGHDETVVNNKIIEDLPKTKPISEIISAFKPAGNDKSLDALFPYQATPITEILSDLKPAVIKTNEKVSTKQNTNNHLVPDQTNNNEVDKNNINIRPEQKSFKSREFRTLESIDDNFKSLQFIQDYHQSKSKDDLKRAKSLAELDLGDAVKGKVNKMIVRMNSAERILAETKEVIISIKEMPRKRSVSEKIALFERKLTVAKEVDSPRVLKQNATEKKQPEELTAGIQEKITELITARVRYGKMDAMPRIQLANGVAMPVMAIGTALLDPRLAYHIVTAAIDLGYRAVDTAYIYGNERVVGEAIRAKIDDGTVTREDLFITSKLWSTFHRTDLVRGACEASLQAMGLDYFDLYLIHNPMSFKEGNSSLPKIATVLQYSEHDYLDAWFGMEALGSRVKAVGLSNFNSAQIRRVLDRARVKPVVNQVECHPYLSQQRLDEFCSERNITLSCFGVLGSKGTPLEYKSGHPAAIDDPLLQVLASGLNVSPAQLLIRYQIECGHSVVVKSSTAAHLWDNLQALTFNLTSGQVDALHALNRNKRTFTFKGMGDTHKNYPFNAAF